MKMKAIKPFSYGGRALRSGQTFDTKTAKHAEILAAAKKARYVEDPKVQAKAPAAAQAEAGSAEPQKTSRSGTRRASQTSAVRTAGTGRRTYRRTDLKADD